MFDLCCLGRKARHSTDRVPVFDPYFLTLLHLPSNSVLFVGGDKEHGVHHIQFSFLSQD